MFEYPNVGTTTLHVYGVRHLKYSKIDAASLHLSNSNTNGLIYLTNIQRHVRNVEVRKSESVTFDYHVLIYSV